MRTKILSAVISIALAGCLVPNQARYQRANRVEQYRIKQQADAMQAAAAGVVFQPIAKTP